MSEITLRNGRVVGDYLKPYIVAELNTSHFGDIAIAKDMIRQAKEVGCDCVKFQSWSAETLYCESYFKENAIAKRVFKKFAMDKSELKKLSIFSEQNDIDFSSTPYSLEEARFLVEECGVPFVKIASMELNNLPYLKQLGQLDVPLVLSTGMGTIDEIIEAVKTIQDTGNERLIILHCTSVYPASPDVIRLKNILGLKEIFPKCPIGYSDHSQGIEIPSASIALGACLIEKHFTLDSSRIGMDNQMATEPEEMQAMVKACHKIYESLGGKQRFLSEEEKNQIPKMRRSVVLTKELQAGDVLTEECIEFNRPGNGIPPSEYQKIIGCVLTRSISKGSILNKSDLK